MKNFIILLLMAFWGHLAQAQTPLSDLNWKPYWGDNFNDSGNTHIVNKNFWEYQFTEVDSPYSFCWGDTDQYARIDSGILKLSCLAKDTTYWNWHNSTMYPVHYVASRVISREFVRWGYIEGRWRVRHANGSIPDSITMKGVSPSLWMWSDGDHYKVPQNTPGHNRRNEIDISETMKGKHNWNNLGHNIHYLDVDKTNATHYHYLSEYYNPRYAYANIDFWNWHTYGLEWDSTQLKFYIDNVLVHRINNGDKPYDYIDDYNNYNYANNFFKIPNLRHMAIILGIQPDISRLDTSLYNGSARKGYPNSTNLWPVNLEIDYVKVFKFDPDCGGNIYSTSYNFSNYTHKIYQNVVIGGSGGTSIINSGQNISIRATDLIQLDEGFEVKNGAIFHADVNPCNQ